MRRISRPLAVLGIGALVAIVTAVVLLPDRDGAEVLAGRDWRASRLVVAGRTRVQQPTAIAVSATAVWVAQATPQTVTRVDARTNRADRPISLPAAPSAVVATSSAIWVTSTGADVVVRIDPTTRFVSGVALPAPGRGPIAVGDGFAWIALDEKQAAVVDQATGEVEQVPLGIDAVSMAYASGTLWAIDATGRIVAVDTASMQVRDTLDLGTGDYRLAVGGGAVWACDRDGGGVRAVALDLSNVIATVHPSRGARGLAFGAGAAWIVADGRLSAIEPGTKEVIASLDVGEEVVDVAIGPRDVWVVDRGSETLVRVPLR